MSWRYSPQAKMLSLAAYERARRALREAYELHSRGARVESNRTHRSKREVWRYCLTARYLHLRFTSELVDLRTGYAAYRLRYLAWRADVGATDKKRNEWNKANRERQYSFVLSHEWSSHSVLGQKRKESRKDSLFFFGRSVEIRTPGLQYPKLARYQLRYTSKY